MATNHSGVEQRFLAGIKYYYGIGGNVRNEKLAQAFLQGASTLGDECAKGICLMEGWGPSKAVDNHRAAALFRRKATEKLCSFSMYRLGICFENGYGVEKDLKAAANWYDQAAKRGNHLAQYNIGVCYDQGIGVLEDPTTAVKWYELSAGQGNMDAACNLALCYEHGRGLAQDTAKALKWISVAAEANDPHGQFILGLYYEHGKGLDADEKAAAKWYLKAATQGHIDACFNLAFLYELDLVPLIPGVLQAVKESQGDTPGHSKSGNDSKAAKEQHSTSVNLQIAVAWYRRAAEQGDSHAQHRLARFYEFGEGLQKDEHLAASWYRRAAKQGNLRSMGRLARIYEEGSCRIRDAKQARLWLNVLNRMKPISSTDAQPHDEEN
mmetsp:Transcript_16992/g.41725  ORF Transcript_16992/g.41725 Transcript_16992/m.41725 type:complete len:381 (-) Transcript_16992:179-1321(-)|eukprot:CAMPEP_0114507218 /NCGR_PEP_ID=MMETSP0109-20121206/11884_1 /TAXON_ID=29199 /ORGANISM="Chlorarachnion reptans, Strain CCCM449" /LENGTH=380 /DNA_ID=CAMNT_0001685939 /DNA_START=252 /DNA_END=1394 /DNA_ORIENTATION=-